VPGFGSLRGFSTTAAPVAPDQPTVQLTMQRYIVYAIREISRCIFYFGFSLPSLIVSIFSSLLYAQRLFRTSATG